MVYEYETKPRQRRPFPEAVLPGTWIIEESGLGGATSYDPSTGKSRMHVPMTDDTPDQLSTRIHEMLHVRFTRWTEASCDRGGRPSTIERWFMNVFEDLRIEKLGALAHKTLDVPEMVRQHRLWERYLNILHGEHTQPEIPSWYVAGKAVVFEPQADAVFQAWEYARKRLEADGYDAWRVMNILRGLAQDVIARPHWEVAADATRRAVELFRKEDERREKAKSGETSSGEPGDPGESDEEEAASEALDDAEARAKDTGPGMPLDAADSDGKFDPTFTDKHAHSAPIKQVHHDLVHPQGKGFIADKVKRPSQMGAVPKYMHRWCIDMGVFEARKRSHGRAVILVDGSGSMSLTHQQVEQVMRAAPGSTVAVYHARGSVNACNDRAASGFGCLHIVADGGKRIAEEIPQGAANACDIDALEWLVSERAMHRIWISDGMVTGITVPRGKPIAHEVFARNLVRLAKDIVKANGLRHVLTVEDGIALLQKLYRRGSDKGLAKKTWKSEAKDEVTA